MTTSDAASDTAPAAPPPHPWPELGLRGAALAVIAWTAVVLAVSLLAHPTPFYTVETDLVGECLPAALAALTRTNALFLAPVALVTLARRPGWARALPAYAAGLAAPLAVWAAVARHAGGLPPDRNYLNVAWELYGRGVPWDTFEATTGSRFHSMAGVFAFDPLAAAAHIVSNLVVQRL